MPLVFCFVNVTQSRPSADSCCAGWRACELFCLPLSCCSEIRDVVRHDGIHRSDCVRCIRQADTALLASGVVCWLDSMLNIEGKRDGYRREKQGFFGAFYSGTCFFNDILHY